MDFHPSGTCIGVATSDKKVKVYDLRMRRLQQSYSTHKGPVSQVSFHPNGNYLGKLMFEIYRVIHVKVDKTKQIFSTENI